MAEGPVTGMLLTMCLRGTPKLLHLFVRLTLCRAWLRAKYCMVLPSFVCTLGAACVQGRQGGRHCMPDRARAPNLLALAVVCRRMDAVPHRS